MLESAPPLLNTSPFLALKGRSLEPDAEHPLVVTHRDGLRVRYRLPREGLADLDEIVRVQQAGWEEDLAFPREWIERDLLMFPGLRVLAVLEDGPNPGRLVGGVAGARFGLPEGIALDIMATMDPEKLAEQDITGGWDQLYEHYRDPHGRHLEGTDLVIDPECQGKGIAGYIIAAFAKAIAMAIRDAELDTTDPGIDQVCSQSRLVGLPDWAAERGGVSDENHKRYVEAVMCGEAYDRVMSAYARVARQDPEGKIVSIANTHAHWPGDHASAERGVRFNWTPGAMLLRRLWFP